MNPLYKKKSLLQRYLSDHKSTFWVLMVLLFVAIILPKSPMAVLAAVVLLIHLHYKFQHVQYQQINIYKQQQALVSIHRLIGLRSPLPVLGEWAASPDFLTIISEIILDRKPETIVECGSGVSTVVMAYLLEKNECGRIFSLENKENFHKKNRQLIVRHHLEKYVSIVRAPLISHKIGDHSLECYDTKQIADLQSIDLLIIDGPAGNRYPVLPVLFNQLADDVLVIIDDCKREKDGKNILRWLADFPFEAEWIDTEKGTCILRKTL